MAKLSLILRQHTHSFSLRKGCTGVPAGGIVPLDLDCALSWWLLDAESCFHCGLCLPGNKLCTWTGE